MNKNNADAMLKKTYIKYNRWETTYAGKSKAAYALLQGTNGSIGNNVLSEEYYVTYDGNVQNAHVTFDLPGASDHST